MKLHLPLSLRKGLLAVLSAATVLSMTSPAEAGRLHADVTMQTYTDFGQNMGRYVVGDKVNALLGYIRTQEGGIRIHYTDGTAPYTISNDQGMIDFRGSGDNGAYVAVSPNVTATVLHNDSINASFGERVVGADYAINYSAIDVRYATKFRLGAPDGDDYMLQRQSKIATDAVWNPVAKVESEAELDALIGQKLYHSGAGVMKMQGADGKVSDLTGPYQYIVGDISTIAGDVGYGKETVYDSDNGNIFVAAYLTEFYYNTGATEGAPLPNMLQGGDSGSPVYIYNAESGRYEYLAALQAGDDATRNYMRGNPTWIAETLEGFNSTVDMSNFSEVYLNAIETLGASHSETVEGTPYSTTLYSGAAKAADGTTLATYNGVQSGEHTWKNLSGIKNEQNWYAYDSDAYLNQRVEDLFYTNNLVFNATAAENRIVLNDTVDLGIGYTEFNGGKFTITSAGDGSYQLDSAGYVINEGAEVHLQLVNSENRMTEWRKIGDGALYIDGTGDTNALLSVGGSGKTYLQQTGGYAAYNVLASSGATVSIKDTSQIERDFTFGVGGGTLDMSGNSMDWYTTAETATDDTRFSINALTEEAMIHNSTGDTLLTYKEGKDTTYLGSFSDSSHGSLSIDYQGGGTWTLHSIHTDLSHNAGSGLTVSNGKVVLAGTLTRHGMGSVDGTTQDRITHSNDWHYADATMNVSVKNGATFELGSHARLQGDVTLEQGGTYIMREGVQQQYEYVEGGAILEDTSKYSSYYGHKGDVTLAAGSNMKVEYSTGTSANTNYAGNISGEGTLTVAAGTSGGTLTLSGDNSAFTGTKVIESGGVVIAEAAALGDTSTAARQWQVGAEGWIASQKHTAAELLRHISSSSKGTLALSCDTTTQLDFSQHSGMYLGAEKGKTVNYGEAGTTETLNAIDGAWRLGGGGGTLVVNFKLSGANDLILGASESASGIVHLANTNNDFTGSVRFTGENVILTYENGALGDNNAIQLAYGNSVILKDANEIYFLTHDSAGMALVDAIPDADLYLNSHDSLSIGSSTDVTYTGEITVADNQAYRFGATWEATFTVDTMLQSGHDLVIDSQSTSGGTVMLAGNSIQTVANLSVSANSTFALGQQVNAAGDLSLAASSVLNLNGHKLSVQGDMELLGQVQDTVGGGELAWTLADGEHELNASIDIDHFRINGTGTLILNGSNMQIDTYHVDGGTLRLGDAVSLNDSNTVRMSGGTLHTGSHEYVNFNIAVEAGGTAVVEHTGAAHNNGFYAPVNNYTGFQGNIIVGQGGELKLTGSGIYEFMDRTYGSSGGTINLACSDVYLYDAGDDGPDGGTIFKGTLRISENVNIHAQNWTDNLNHHIECLQIDTGKQLSLLDNGWNSVWNIGSLSGEGDLIWNSEGGHTSGSYRMILSGESDYSGRIELNRTAGLQYSGYIELASDKAAGNATICLNGQSSTKAILAVNSADAHIGGLEGNQYSFVYAGSSVASTSSAAPATTRAASLTIDTASGKDHTYAGTIGNSTDTAANGLTLVKTGSGTQRLTGTAYLSNLSVEEGSLYLTGTTKSVKGNVSLATGAYLSMGDLTIGSGQTFAVTGSDSGGSAVFDGKLTVSGGTLEFDGRALSTGMPALSLQGGIGMTSNSTLNFTNCAYLETGMTYTLASGNWSSSILGSLEIKGLSFYDPTFTISDGSLQMSLTMKEGYKVWAGNNEVLQPNNKVIFYGAGEHAAVSVDSNGTVGTGVFCNEDAFTIGSANGSSLAFTSIEKSGSGALEINTAVRADTLQVQEGFTLNGAGNLSIGTLDVQSGAVLRVQDLDVSVDNEINSQAQLHLADGASLTTSQTSIASMLKLGESGAATRVELGIGGGELSLTGNVAIENDTTLSVKGSGKLHFNSVFNSLKALELKNGVNMEQSAELLTHLVLDGGTVSAKGNCILKGDITVTNNGIFTFTGDTTVSDTLDWNTSGKTITVDGGTLDLGATRQSMGSWLLLLSDGAKVTGSGGDFKDWNDGNTYTTSLDYYQNDSTIKATSGESTISAITQLRGTEGSINLNYDVSENATLTVNGLIHSNNRSGCGSITKKGDGLLVLDHANTYAGTTTIEEGTLRTSTDGALGTSAVVINGGKLEIYGGENRNASILQGDVTVNGGEFLISGHNNAVVDTNVTVNAGGTMRFAGAGSNMLDSNVSGMSLVVDGGSLDFGNTRQMMGSWGLTLKNGATVTGAGGSYADSIYTAAMDLNNNFTINAESGVNIIASNVRMRGGDERTLSFNISEGATVIMDGRIHADGNDALGTLVKTGDGKLSISSRVTANTLALAKGELVLSHTDAENVVVLLDGSLDGTASGSLRIAEKSDLTVTGAIWGRSASAIVLEEGATLTNNQDGVIISNRKSGSEASLKYNVNNGEYDVSNSDFELTNGHLAYTGAEAKELGNKLTKSSVENAGSNTLTVKNSNNTITGVVASGGNMALHHMGEAMSLDLLEIAAGKAVNAYVGEDMSMETGNTTVTGSAILSGKAVLNTGLTLGDGATLEMRGLENGAVMLSGALTFGSGLVMGESLLASVEALGYGEILNLFTGVTEVSLPVVAATESGQVLASSVFSNVQSESLYVEYQVIDNVGSLMVVNLPEPATTTLGLLALTALAARRRRKE